MIFFRNITLSSRVTCVLGNDGSNSACSSHAWARGWLVTSFFSGSLTFSSSLRAALPPMFWTRVWVSKGPRCAMALRTVACKAVSSVLRDMKPL